MHRQLVVLTPGCPEWSALVGGVVIASTDLSSEQECPGNTRVPVLLFGSVSGSTLRSSLCKHEGSVFLPNELLPVNRRPFGPRDGRLASRLDHAGFWDGGVIGEFMSSMSKCTHLSYTAVEETWIA